MRRARVDQEARAGRFRWSAAPLAAVTFLIIAALMAVASSASASEGPIWRLAVVPNADYVISGGQYSAEYKIELENVGDESTSSSEGVTIENVPPAGTASHNALLFYSAFSYANLANFGMCSDDHTCEWPSGPFGGFLPKAIPPGQRLIMTVLVDVPAGVEGNLEDVAKVSGGGLPPVEATGTNVADPNPPFGAFHFDSSITDASKTTPYTQAGGHPFQFVTDFHFGTYSSAMEVNPSFPEWERFGAAPLGDPKEVGTELPPGLLANPQGVPRCSLAEYFGAECPPSTMVGTAGLRQNANEAAFNRFQPIFNLQPSGAYPGELGIPVAAVPFIVITAGIRSDGDYGVSAVNVAPQAGVNHIQLTFWGVPADPSHDSLRGLHGGADCTDTSAQKWALRFESAAQIEHTCETEELPGPIPAGVPPTPFLTMPTECSGEPLSIEGDYNTWPAPEEFARAIVELPPVDGCNALIFEPTIEARPTTTLADAPSGLEIKLHVPQNEDPEGVATPELKGAVVTLPKGLSLNPSAANGLEGCTEAEIGLHSLAPAACPDRSKIGLAKVHTPLLNVPMEGALYLATPYQNPSGSLLAGYIALEGSGVKIKLAGSFETDPQSGQITAKFTQNPQLPFEDLELNVFGGARGALRTPAVCGTYETTSSLTPFSAPESGPPASPSTTFETSAAENGGACPTSASQLPNSPLLRAGTETPQAGIYSPFALRLVREDGSQEVTGAEVVLPQGLVAKIAGIPYCSDAAIAASKAKSGVEEKASPSCPAASEIGTVDVGAGTGPTPIAVPGRVYLAGPYKGAPLSVVIITPATAGPFDLGTVSVRAALHVNPQTTQITAQSDEIPHILHGIPLDIRSVTMKLARQSFTRNPTSCEAGQFGGAAASLLGATSPLAQRFQVGGCRALEFKPKLALSLKGATKRTGHPALTAVLKMPEGGANIARAQVTLPPSEQIDNAHIGDVCTQKEFAEGNVPGEKCKPTSIYGHATAWSPLLDHPLEGPVFLKTPGHKLPDLLVALNGQINVALEGTVDSSPNGGLRNTFELVPDVPVSKFVLEMKGGAKGLLQNNRDICKHRLTASAIFTGQNTKSVELNPALKLSCGKGGKKHSKHHRAGRRSAR